MEGYYIAIEQFAKCCPINGNKPRKDSVTYSSGCIDIST
jgi:hypothetical protein